MPWELDVAVLRRFERKVLVPLPDVADRLEIFRLEAGSTNCHELSEYDF
jgi:vacuolar protein-sorting-associated protein 4